MTTHVQVMAFCKNLLNTIDHLKGKFPDDRHVSFIRTQVETASRLTPRLVVMHFVKEICPFEKRIMDRDEAFFLDLVQDDDYVDVLSHLKLDEKWAYLDDTDKETLWISIQRLLTLGKKIYPHLGSVGS